MLLSCIAYKDKAPTATLEAPVVFNYKVLLYQPQYYNLPVVLAPNASLPTAVLAAAVVFASIC